MEENKKMIVVPWDFTQVAENALEHAVKISRMVDSDICLLHIIDSGMSSKDAGLRKAMLKQAAETGHSKYGIPVRYQIEKGTIFSSIADFVNEKDNNVSLVIMGTHGIRGMQKFTGSWALKVVVKSKIPFIVIQDPPGNHEKYNNIVFPIDFRSENKEKMKMAIFMGKYFDSKIHMLVALSSDKSLLKKTHANLNYAIKYLIQNNIEYQIHEVPKKKFAQQTIEFAQEINADIILIMTTKNITMADYMLGASEQYIIANSLKIPVCCVNPKASFAKVGQFMYG